MLQYMQPGVRLYHFLREIYGDQPAMARVEVDVEGLSGGVQGTPHLEATQVRIYDADGVQLLPDFEEVSYWQEMLAVSPNLFQECTTHQDRLQIVQDLLKEERIYLDYGLDWPDLNEKVTSPLRFTREELRQMASKAEALNQEKLDGNTDEKSARSSEHALKCAESALATLSEEGVQNVFGDEVTEVLFDVLKKFIASLGKIPPDPASLTQHGFDPQLLSPRVMASCHSDDFVVEVKKFDATLWLAQASDEQLQALRNEGYGGNDTADRVAEFMAIYDPYVHAMFHYNDTLPKSVELRGFECHVNEEEAEAWIAWHRPHLFTDKEKEKKSK